MTEHAGLPVLGYQAQKQAAVDAVNASKVLEERVLRQFDLLAEGEILKVDPRMLALARTKVQEAFMWANRAVFQPGRVALPEDAS